MPFISTWLFFHWFSINFCMATIFCLLPGTLSKPSSSSRWFLSSSINCNYFGEPQTIFESIKLSKLYCYRCIDWTTFYVIIPLWKWLVFWLDPFPLISLKVCQRRSFLYWTEWNFGLSTDFVSSWAVHICQTKQLVPVKPVDVIFSFANGWVLLLTKFSAVYK